MFFVLFLLPEPIVLLMLTTSSFLRAICPLSCLSQDGKTMRRRWALSVSLFITNHTLQLLKTYSTYAACDASRRASLLLLLKDCSRIYLWGFLFRESE